MSFLWCAFKSDIYHLERVKTVDIGIIGGGAIGLLVSALLSSEGHQVTVYVKREDQRKKLQEMPLILEPENKEFKMNAAFLSQMTKKELIIVCVKQHHLKDISTYILPDCSTLLFLQNGMGHIDLLDNWKQNRSLFLGTVEHGALRKEDNIVTQTGKGRIKLAAYYEKDVTCQELALKLNSEHFPVVIEDNWHLMLSEKLVINAVINPLTTIFDVDNEEIITNKYIKKIAWSLTAEVCEVLKLEFEKTWKRIQFICENTASNTSSMRADIRNNQQTEIDYITGYILNKSKKEQKYTEFTYRAVKALEAKGFS